MNSAPRKSNTLIFDFDGTIADTLALLINISNQLADEYGYRKVNPDDVRTLKDQHIVDIVRQLQIPTTKIPVIMFKVRQKMGQHITQAPIVKGLKEILVDLQRAGHRMGILSSNSRTNIHLFLTHHDIHQFEFLQTSVGMLGKPRRLQHTIREHNLHADDVIYVADEIRDIEAARRAGVKVAAVAWGYNAPASLKTANPDFFLESPEDLLKFAS